MAKAKFDANDAWRIRRMLTYADACGVGVFCRTIVMAKAKSDGDDACRNLTYADVC